MGKDNHAYFTQRAAEESAAAERATSAVAAQAHRELSLRYALKLVLPDPAGANDDGRLVGQPKRAPATAAAPAGDCPARRFGGA